nr:hypothetical protein Iba_scaffold2753CG0830 [Ipomoea batatas]
MIEGFMLISVKVLQNIGSSIETARIKWVKEEVALSVAPLITLLKTAQRTLPSNIIQNTYLKKITGSTVEMITRGLKWYLMKMLVVVQEEIKGNRIMELKKMMANRMLNVGVQMNTSTEITKRESCMIDMDMGTEVRKIEKTGIEEVGEAHHVVKGREITGEAHLVMKRRDPIEITSIQDVEQARHVVKGIEITGQEMILIIEGKQIIATGTGEMT